MRSSGGVYSEAFGQVKALKKRISWLCGACTAPRASLIYSTEWQLHTCLLSLPAENVGGSIAPRSSLFQPDNKQAIKVKAVRTQPINKAT